jgi:hypothetical protein
VLGLGFVMVVGGAKVLGVLWGLCRMEKVEWWSTGLGVVGTVD